MKMMMIFLKIKWFIKRDFGFFMVIGRIDKLSGGSYY